MLRRAKDPSNREVVRYFPVPRFPDIEVMVAENTSRAWSFCCHAYSLALYWDWTSRVHYGGHEHTVDPSSLFCGTPGEVVTTRRIIRGGTFRVLSIDPTAFSTWLAERRGPGTRVARTAWRRSVTVPSPELRRKLAAAFSMVDAATAPEVETAVVDGVELAFDQLVGELSGAAVSPAMEIERVRSFLHDDPGWTDLATLAKETGLSRFQVLRGFKKRFGVSPHAYQVSHRIVRARELLRAGATPADVAIDCGFADQSHFIRCFKRIVGVTPGTFVRSTTSARR